MHMEGIVGSLRMGWDALLLKEDAYERMSKAANPVVQGLVLILVVGVAVALLGLVGDVLEWASVPDLTQIRDIVLEYVVQMPGWEEAARDPVFMTEFMRWYDFGWDMALRFAQPNIGQALAGIITTPLGLVLRWLIYGLLAYLFARLLGGTGDFSATLGVLALAVAPQALSALAIFPYVDPGSMIAVWGLLCAYLGLKVVHGLSWYRTVWTTLLPFLLVVAVAVLGGCLGSAMFAALVRGG
jgi:hypothetical protein